MLEDASLRDVLTLFLVKGGSVPAKAVFSPTGAFNPILCGYFGTRRTLTKAMEDTEEIKRKYVESGLLGDDMGEGGWSPLIIDQGHMEYFENETFFDPAVPESTFELVKLTMETNQSLAENKLMIPFASQVKAARAQGMKVHDSIAPYMNSDYRVWQRKFKQAFDPNDASDAAAYIDSEEEE